MARRLDSFPERERRAGKYPWSEWTDGSIWEVVEGADFDVEPEAFQNLLYQRATREGDGVKVKTLRRETEDGQVAIVFQFIRAETGRRR